MFRGCWQAGGRARHALRVFWAGGLSRGEEEGFFLSPDPSKAVPSTIIFFQTFRIAGLTVRLGSMTRGD